MFSVLEGVIPDTLVPFLRIVYLCQFFVDFSGAVDKTVPDTFSTRNEITQSEKMKKIEEI